MTSHTNRRHFFKLAALGAAAPLVPPQVRAMPEPYERKSTVGLRIGLAAYSFLKYFPVVQGRKNPEVPEAQKMSPARFIRFCAEQGCGGAELTSYIFDDSVSARELSELRLLAHQLGVEVSGTAIGNNFTYSKGSKERAEQIKYTKLWIDHASVMGAPHIRVFAGVAPQGMSEKEAEVNVREAVEEVVDYAADKGIMLGIENHDYTTGTASKLLSLVKSIDSPWLGVNLDTANFRVEDPYPEIEACVPYALNVQIKARIKHGGPRPTDFERIGRILKEGGYRGYVVLEYEEPENPYEKVPELLGKLREFCDG